MELITFQLFKSLVFKLMAISVFKIRRFYCDVMLFVFNVCCTYLFVFFFFFL